MTGGTWRAQGQRLATPGGDSQPAHIEGRFVGTDDRLTALSSGRAPAPDLYVADLAMQRAFSFDATPPIEVLEHLEAEQKSAAVSSPAESSARVLRLGERRPARGIDR